MANRYSSLKELFTSHYDFKISESQCKSIVAFTQEYELRDDHANALNSPYIGLHGVYFLPKDQNFIFDLFGVIKTDLKDQIHNCKTINPDHIVISDPFNQLVIWLIYKLNKTTNISDKKIYQTQFSLLKLLQYKFFSSIVNYYYPYGANEDYMVAAIERLSGKFDIKKKETSTWKLVIEKRAEEMLGDNSIHKDALTKYEPDDKITYVISDTQTRIRNKIKLVTESYYNVREHGEKVRQYNISDEVDGEQLLKTIESKYDAMTIGISRQAISTDRFINTTYVKLTAELVKNIPPDLIRKFLVKFTDIAAQHYKDGKSKKWKQGDQYPIYIGYSILIEKLIIATYGSILRRKDVDINSKISILEKTINQYRASRINDEQVLAVKESVLHLVNEIGLTKREETIGALRLSFIVYIMLLSFDYT